MGHPKGTLKTSMGTSHVGWPRGCAFVRGERKYLHFGASSARNIMEEDGGFFLNSEFPCLMFAAMIYVPLVANGVGSALLLVVPRSL